MRIAQMAERAGLQSLWVNDRLVTSDGMVRMEAWTMLSVAAMYTTRIRVGAMFAAGLRRPQALAAMVGSMDTVVDGRLELGVVAGWYEREYEGLGLPFPDADTRIEEMGSFARTLHTLIQGEPIVEGGPSLGVFSPQPGGPPLTLEARGRRQVSLGVEFADSIMLPTRPMENCNSACCAAQVNPLSKRAPNCSSRWYGGSSRSMRKTAQPAAVATGFPLSVPA